MRSRSTHLVLNPASAGGRTGRRQKEILRAVEQRFGPVTLVLTEQNGHIPRSAIDGSLILVAGGDGTIQHVVNALLQNGLSSGTSAELAILSTGTGCGFAQSLGIPHGLESQVRLAAEGRATAVDLGRLEYTGFDGTRMLRYFINECQLGVGAEVVKQVETGGKRMGGRFAFGLATLNSVLRHRNQPMVITADGIRLDGRFCGVTIANGARMGGGMNLVPGASVEDRHLDLLTMGDLTVVQRLCAFPRIYNGSHAQSKGFSIRQADHVTIRSDESVVVAADGEILGMTPCTIGIVPSAIRIRRERRRQWNP